MGKHEQWLLLSMLYKQVGNLDNHSVATWSKLERVIPLEHLIKIGDFVMFSLDYLTMVGDFLPFL